MPTSIQTEQFEHADHPVHYALAGNQHSKIGLLFIHGTPGDWAAFRRYLALPALQEHFLMISLDRPGWGESDLPMSKVDGRFRSQSDVILAIMQRHPGKRWILIGHSLGASIAPQVNLMAMDSVAGMVLLAGSLSPRLGKPRWYNRAASTWLVSRMVGKSMRKANREIMALRAELQAMQTALLDTSLDSHVIVIQGMKDKLVSPRNTDYVSQTWLGVFASLEIVRLKKAGHFLPWRHQDTVLKAISTVHNRILYHRD